MSQESLPKALLALLRARLPQMQNSLRDLTLLESPSLEKEFADRCCRFLAAEWQKRGARVETLSQKQRGDHLRVIWPPKSADAAQQLLVLGHYDTVYPSGTLAKMPFRVSGGRASG